MTNSEQELKPEQLLQGRVDYLEHEIARYKVANAKLAAMVYARPTPTPDDAALDALGDWDALHNADTDNMSDQEIKELLDVVFNKHDQTIRAALTNACKENGDKLPCALRVGAGTFRKGVSVSTAQGAIDRLYERVKRIDDNGEKITFAGLQNNAQGVQNVQYTDGTPSREWEEVPQGVDVEVLKRDTSMIGVLYSNGDIDKIGEIQGWNECIDHLHQQGHLRAIPEGYALVPVEPTLTMVEGGEKTINNILAYEDQRLTNKLHRLYKVMIQAAPKHEGE